MFLTAIISKVIYFLTKSVLRMNIFNFHRAMIWTNHCDLNKLYKVKSLIWVRIVQLYGTLQHKKVIPPKKRPKVITSYDRSQNVNWAWIYCFVVTTTFLFILWFQCKQGRSPSIGAKICKFSDTKKFWE